MEEVVSNSKMRFQDVQFDVRQDDREEESVQDGEPDIYLIVK